VFAQLVAKIYNINPHPHWEIFLGLLCFLFSLHLYWSAACLQPNL
jgi:ceramide synthetase